MKKITFVLGLVLSIVLVQSNVFAEATPRIAVWQGKVNQHIDTSTGQWTSDPDGSSGAELDKLSYCKKWYPNTTSVQPDETETISTWKRASYFEQSDYTNTVPTYRCVETTVNVTPSLKVLSPNGGETYTAGQQIAVTWNSSSIPTNATIRITLASTGTEGYALVDTQNDGYETVTLPANVMGENRYWPYMQYGRNFKIFVSVLNNQTGATGVFDLSDNLFTIKTPAPSSTGDTTARIMLWPGKVNQYTDANGVWHTDPDGRSGGHSYLEFSNDYGGRELEYCKKWYPNSTSAEPYKNETINTWRAAGNSGSYSGTFMSYKCLQGTSTGTPRITVVSPNGGEVYQAGQQITVKWNSANIPVGEKILIVLQGNFGQGYQLNNVISNNDPKLLNDGVEVVTLPILGPWPQWNLMQFGKKYRIKVATQSSPTHDLSDTLFTVEAPSTTGCAINSFSANPSTVSAGGISRLSYEMNETCRRFSIPEVNYSSFGVGGYQQIGPIDQTTSYTLKASSNEGCDGTVLYSTTNGQACNYTIGTTTVTVNSSASALPAGCSSTTGYSTTTGMPCGAGSSTIPGCTPGNIFSPITGQSCGKVFQQLTQPVKNATTNTFVRELTVGATGADVTALQTRLKAEGVYTSPITGYFGKMTEAGVKKFQIKHSIPTLGAVDSRTLEVLNK